MEYPIFPAPAKRPPLGVVPRHLHDLRRLNALASALYDYTATFGVLADLPLNHIEKWTKEAHDIAVSLREQKP